MKNLAKNTKKIGLLVGQGTGRVLVDVLKRFIMTVCEHQEILVEFETCDHVFRTSSGVKGRGEREVAQSVIEDTQIAQSFLQSFSKKGGTAIFRTSFNAEALYKLRQWEHAIKDVAIPVGEGNTVLLVRDLAQGHYANDTLEMTEDTIHGTFHFSKEGYKAVATYARKRAEGLFEEGYDVHFGYKIDLYGNVFKRWFMETMKERPLKTGCKAYISQPDTAITVLNKFIKTPQDKKPLVFVTSNEFGDVAIEHIILSLGYANKNTMYSSNYYSRSGVREYQTVHGSADDVSDSSVNPEATLRAAAAIVEEELGVSGGKKTMEQIIKEIEQEQITTPDMGGQYTTKNVVDEISMRFLARLQKRGGQNEM